MKDSWKNKQESRGTDKIQHKQVTTTMNPVTPPTDGCTINTCLLKYALNKARSSTLFPTSLENSKEKMWV